MTDKCRTAEIEDLEASLDELREALLAMKNGDCWCDQWRYPTCGHADRCNQAREAVEAARKGSTAEDAEDTEGEGSQKDE